MLLVELATNGVPWEEVANRLGRSEKACKAKYHYMGEVCRRMSKQQVKEIK